MTNALFEKGALVFDIGANNGGSADIYCNLEAGKIVSVEPCLNNYLELLERAKSHPQIIPMHAACWSENRLISVCLSLKQSGLSSVQPDKWQKAYPDVEWGNPEIVPCVTLDEMAAFFGIPDFVKVDVEGSEYEVLSGMSFTPKALAFEFHSMFTEDTLRCMKLLADHGFTKACFVKTDIDPMKEPDLSFDDFLAQFEAVKPFWGNITVKR